MNMKALNKMNNKDYFIIMQVNKRIEQLGILKIVDLNRNAI